MVATPGVVETAPSPLWPSLSGETTEFREGPGRVQEETDPPAEQLEGGFGAPAFNRVPTLASARSSGSAMGAMLSNGRRVGSKAAANALDMIDMVARNAEVVMGEEPSQFCKQCKRWKFIKTHFLIFSLAWLIGLFICFFLVGLTADLNLFGKPMAFYMWMPFMGLITWALVVLRFATAVWISARASDATGSLVFLATFVVLHLFTWQQVGTSVGRGFLMSDYYRSYSALARRMQVPQPGKVKSFQDIYAWLEDWVDEWLPETMQPNMELHPGWTSMLAPEVWTQRVRPMPCDYMSFSGAQCTQAGGLDDHCEKNYDWTLTWPGGEKVLTHRSGEFSNFRGEKRESPVFPGKLQGFRFQRGYSLSLGEETVPGSGMLPATANRSWAREIISRMCNATFIDSYTRVIYLDTTFLHFFLGQWINLRVIFEQDPAGYIEPSLKVYQGPIPLCRVHDESQRAALTARLAELPGKPPQCNDVESCRQMLTEFGVGDGDYSCENVVVPTLWPMALAYFIGSAPMFYFPVSAGSGWLLGALVALTSFLLLEELQQMLLRGKEYFKDISNYFEWATIISVFMMFGKSLEQQGATPQDGMTWNLYCVHIETLQRMCGFACFLWWMRLLNFVSNLHPRLKMLIHTLQNAWVDLGFFCAMFAIVLLAFAMSFHIWFSSSQAAFMDLWGTFVALFRGLIGDISAATLTGDEFTTVFYMTYIILSLLIMVNVFIAIISASFEVQQAELRAKEAQKREKLEELERWLLADPREEEGAQPTDGDVLKVVMWCGRGLRSTDMNGLADPKAVFGLRKKDTCPPRARAGTMTTISLQMDGCHVSFEAPVLETSVVLGTLDPDWNQTAAFNIPRGAAEADVLELFAELLDEDLVKKNDSMGKVAAPLSKLLDNGPTANKQRASKMSVASGGSTEGRVTRHSLKVEYYHNGNKRNAGTIEVSAFLHASDALSATSTRDLSTPSSSGPAKPGSD